MPAANSRFSLNQMPEGEEVVEIPHATLVTRPKEEVAPAAVEPAGEVLSPSVYIPRPAKRELTVPVTFRIPLPLKDLLEDLKSEYGSYMTTIVVDILKEHLPKVPRKRKRQG